VIRPRQLIRYAAVSGISTGVSQSVLAALVATRSTGAVTANIIATVIGTVPSFELNRRWVWGKTGHRSMVTEIVPFAVISATGLALSTVAVAFASRWADAAALSNTWRTLIVQAANLAAFGVVWVAQFILLDKVLFRSLIPRVFVGSPEGPLSLEDERCEHEHDHVCPAFHSTPIHR
jgi:putative flippase GtrA